MEALTATLTAYLTPMLPFLINQGEKLAEQAAEKLGEGVWAKGKQLWQRITHKADSKLPVLESAAQDLLDSPNDEDAQAAFRMQLKKLLKDDEAFAKEIEELLSDAPSITYQAELHGSGAIAQGEGAVAAGEGGIAIGGDVHGGVVVKEK